jgi:hypothetical protein
MGMDSIIYNIPAALFDTCKERDTIVRSHHPLELVERLSGKDLRRLSYVRLLSLNADIDPLVNWEVAPPVDLVVHDPHKELPLLYKYSPLVARQPVRVCVPVVSGFSKVVKLAVSLNFAVKLELSQPKPSLLEEMSAVLNSYLRQSTVSQPVEYFHSIFLAFYHGHPVTLRHIQEEDPAHFRFLTDSGEERLPGRFNEIAIRGDAALFGKKFGEELLAEEGECCRCGFFQNCCGYFKWPDKAFPCEGVKSIFKTLKKAVEELKQDLGGFQPKQ